MNVQRHSWIYPAFFGFFLGVFLRSVYLFPFTLSLLLIAGAAIFLIIGIWKVHSLVFGSLVLFGIILGSFRMSVALNALPLETVRPFFNEQLAMEGVVIADPDLREGNTKLTVAVDTIEGNETKFRLLATTARHPEFQYGDRIELIGKLTEPEAFSEDGTHIFNYPRWLQKDGIVATLNYGTVSRIESGSGNKIKVVLYGIKDRFLQSIDRLIPEPESGLLAGLLVGSKQSLGKEEQDIFRKAGVVHVVVLSGYNITIVANFFMQVFSFLPFIFNISLGALSMILFAIMAGASATVIRATLMALLVLLAKMLGRETDQFRILLIAAFCMILQNPFILTFDPSFQLSFLATLGLIVFSLYFEQRLSKVPKRFGIQEIMVATLSTQVMVLPFLLWMNGLFSVVALPANLLILGFIPYAMLIGFVAGVLGLISFWIAFPFALIAELILRYQLATIHLFAALPFAAIAIPAFPFLFVLFCYGCYGLVWVKRKRRLSKSDEQTAFSR